MTITYTHEVANSRLGGFSNLLLRWRGSVYKLFYKEFVIYISLYTLLSACYRIIDNDDFKDYFEKLCLQFQTYTDLVPISFVLGFYVSVVVTRWWQQFSNIPWPDRTMMLVASNVHGSDHRGRLIRRTLMRYLSLAEVLTYRSISTSVFKRFPTMQHVIEAGFMTPLEYKEYERVKTDNVKYFVPLLWFANLLSKARQEGRIYDDITYQNILKEMNDYRSCCGTLFGYDWISIPLVYTQVVTVAVYVFFLSTLLSRQYLNVEKEYQGHEVDLYVPIFTIFQFFFYVGWLKVAEQLINPFGEDDDDFEVNMIIDRNIEIALLAVDRLYFTHPKLEKDMYWNNPNPSIPYTAASANHKVDVFLGSTMDMSLDVEDMRFVNNLDAVTESAWELGHDYNHNRIDLPVPTDESQSPPSYSRASKTSNNKTTDSPIKFWLQRIAKEGMDESKISLLEKGSRGDFDDVKIEPDGFDVPSTDEDSADSDVGDGGGSEDEGTDDEHKIRRSSLSSLDDGDSAKSSTKTNPDKPSTLAVRKHTIEDPEEKPMAKKPKNIHCSTPGEAATTTLPSNSKRKQASLKHNFSEGNLKSFGSRFTFGKGRKSPKRKLNAQKSAKKLDFGLPLFGNIDDERHNAQVRNFNLQRNIKRKSITALQRNARRMRYPGNAWLRHKHPQLVITDMSNADYASVTSGAEEKTEFDSPFGSVNSFATSAPSPRPLRFSHFGKQAHRIHRDSMCSSCMTSPGVPHDDFSPLAAFSNTAPNKIPKEDLSGTVVMPFTEDLRRRLRVVSASSPVSSQATSPLLMRSQFSAHPSPYRPQRSSFSETDDQQFNLSPNVKVNTNETTWDKTLEAIGEVSHPDLLDSMKSVEQNTVEKHENETVTDKNLTTAVSNNDNSRLFANRHNVTSLATSSTKTTGKHVGVNRSRSCPLPVNTLALSTPVSQSCGDRLKDKNERGPLTNNEKEIRIDLSSADQPTTTGEFDNADGIVLQFPISDPDETLAIKSEGNSTGTTPAAAEGSSDNEKILTPSTSAQDIHLIMTEGNIDAFSMNTIDQPTTSTNQLHATKSKDDDPTTNSLPHSLLESHDTATIITETKCSLNTKKVRTIDTGASLDDSSSRNTTELNGPVSPKNLPLPDDVIVRYSRTDETIQNDLPTPDQCGSDRRDSEGFQYVRGEDVINIV